MKCPSCHTTLPIAAEECPNCGFSMAGLAIRFGAIPRYDALLTDTTGTTLKAGDFRSVRKYLEFFGRRFPQMRFSVFIHRLRPKTPIKEYTFYIHNSCRFMPYDRNDLNGSILLFIDPVQRDACLMTGYGLEELLPEEELQTILAAGIPAFGKERYAQGITSCVQQAMKALKPGIKNRVQSHAATSDTVTIAEPTS